jgi:glycosyltransferase involved in cell wall biosynthesis
VNQSASKLAQVAGGAAKGFGRTAIVHDWFQGFHGSERVVETLRADLFNAGHPPDIYTFHAARDLLPEELSSAIVKESRISRLPGIRQRGHHPGRWRYLLPLMPYYFDALRLDDYDLVISSSHAFAKRLRVRPGALHVCYCYTPIRYLWLPETEAQRTSGVNKVGLALLQRHLRRLDREAATRPDGFIAISTAVRDRIRRFYGRDADVVHPPVDLADLRPRHKRPGQFLWVHRLVAYKRPELVVEAFRSLPYRLTMVGVGPLETRVRQALPRNVELIGWLTRSRLAKLYGEASGFIHVGEEDFGITMVEALASGTPVIALDAGGARDIVRPERDGVLMREATIASIRGAVTEVARSTFDVDALTARAREFSRERFLTDFAAYVEELRERVRP